MGICRESEIETYLRECALFTAQLDLKTICHRYHQQWLPYLSSSIANFLTNYRHEHQEISTPSLTHEEQYQWLISHVLESSRHYPQISQVLCHQIRQLFQTWLTSSLSSSAKEQVINQLLLIQELQLNTYYARDILRIFREEMSQFFVTNCSDQFSEHCLPKIHHWLTETLIPFASYLFHDSLSSSSSSLPLCLPDLHKELIVYSDQILLQIRSKELFDLIVSYPESTPALLELKDSCSRLISPTLSSTSSTASPFVLLGRELQLSLLTRLLHLGASTSQIIDFYITMIRSLRLLDSSNLLLNHVTLSIRLYLMNRSDTIRCIISLLTEKKNEFQKEFHDGGLLDYGLDSDDESAAVITALTSEDWAPSLRIHDLSRIGKGSRSDKDILAILVSIYGTTDLFVSEYRSILADRLLANLEYDIDEEVATLELLKMRFGEESLHSCEVMLHDIEISKRTNVAIHKEAVAVAVGVPSATVSASMIDCAIISDSYWPTLQADPVTHHPLAAEVLNSFTEAFARVKKPKKIAILPQLGLPHHLH
jgi:anaphase-promoting complex subunit 2